MTKTANVVELNPKASLNSGEFNDITKTLSVVNWSLQVQTILGALGLPVSDNLEKQETALPNGSLAESFGHKTIGAFITRSKDELGLSKDWAEWTSQVKAHRLKSTYNIYSDSPKEIIAQFDDITQFLGRSPATATEYHYTKDSILSRKRQEAERSHKMQINDQRERITDLMKRLETEASQLIEERKSTENLELKLSTTIRDMEMKLNEAKRNHDTELERRLTLQLRELETNFSQQLEETKRQADMRVNEAQERLAELQAHYRDNFVSIQDHGIVLQQLEHERSTNFKLLGSLNESNRKLEAALDQSEADKQALAFEKAQVIDLNNQVESLSTRINAIVRAPFASENNDVVLELQKQIDDLTTKLESRNSNDALVELNKDKMIQRIKDLRGQLTALRAENSTLKGRIKKIKAAFRTSKSENITLKSNIIAISAILAVSAVTTVVMIIKFV